MKRSPLAVPLVAAGLAACADTPTTPLAPPAKPAGEVTAAAFDFKAGLALAVDDARGRVIPTLGTGGAIQGVDATFAALGNAVRSGDAAAVRNAIAGATGTLNALERSAPETDPVEVAALRLVLVNADALFPAA
ncbi:hypothetical protein [Longimicrobium sp.]|uniref:hypothetical protein n=1 Tax=Longimicrobium sp. TaxID=2029185 RepID=UPI002B58B8E8|nr:hypothetical protein [Longimicrobium sp.]HSU15785.1 hypothetical protein [Longimicrobium sp.]